MPSESPTRYWTIDDVPDLAGRVAVVTGANSGIGLDVARGLTRLGATVIMACRTAETAETARTEIVADRPDADISVVPLDLAQPESITRCVDMITAHHSAIDLVIANAGYIPTEVITDDDGIEQGFNVTFLGHFALIGHLLDALLQANAPRVVTVGSLAHRNKRIVPMRLGLGTTRSPMRAYSEAKLAQLVFAIELNRRFTAIGSPAISLAAHPGAAKTGVMRERNALIQRAFHSRFTWPLLRLFVNDARTGSLPILRAAADPTAVGGDYYGPSGPFQLTGPPVRVAPSPTVRDTAIGERLWAFAQAQTGVEFL